MVQIGVVSMPFMQIAQGGPEDGFGVRVPLEGGWVDDSDDLEGERTTRVGGGFA